MYFLALVANLTMWAVMFGPAFWSYFVVQPRLRRWVGIAASHCDPGATAEHDGRAWTGTVDGLRWTLASPDRPPTRAAPAVKLWVVLEARLGFRASRRAENPSALDGPLGDPSFDHNVFLHDDAGCAAAVLTRAGRDTVVDWVLEGGQVGAGAVTFPVAWQKIDPEQFSAWLRKQAALIHALEMPTDRRAALIARLSDPDRTTRLFAAATLAGDLPTDHRAAILDDAWSRLATHEPPPHVVDLLVRHESRGEACTQKLLTLWAAPPPGAAVEVARALGALGTADAILPLLDARPGPVGDARLRAAVDDALRSIRGTLEGIDGGRLAVVEDDATRGGLSVVEDVSGQVALAEAPVADEAPDSLAALYAAAKAGKSTLG